MSPILEFVNSFIFAKNGRLLKILGVTKQDNFKNRNSLDYINGVQ